jgi:hypothetical protein
MRFFDSKWFGQMNSSELLRKRPKIIFILVWLAEEFNFSCTLRLFSLHTHLFRVFSVYEQIHSSFIRIQKDSFCVFSKYVHQNSFEDIPHSAYSCIHKDSLCIFSVEEQIHSTYSQYTYRIVPSILQTHLNNLNIRNEIIFFTAFKFKGTLRQKQL